MIEDVNANPSARTRARILAAERMRRHRRRRRDGLECFTVELRVTEIDAPVRKGMLKPETRHNRTAILDALYDFLDRVLGEPA